MSEFLALSGLSAFIGVSGASQHAVNAAPEMVGVAVDADFPARRRERLAKFEGLAVQWLATLALFFAAVTARVVALALPLSWKWHSPPAHPRDLPRARALAAATVRTAATPAKTPYLMPVGA